MGLLDERCCGFPSQRGTCLALFATRYISLRIPWVLGESAEVGAVYGAGKTNSSALGVFWGGPSGINFGRFTTKGSFNRLPGYETQCPAFPNSITTNGVAGAYAGAGLGLFITNANDVTALKDQFDTWSFNASPEVIPIKFSIQVGYNNGIWIISVTPGPGFGMSESTYPTNTTVKPYMLPR